MTAATHNVVKRRGPVPVRAGIGLRAQHHEDLLRERPAIGWLEAHSENYFADGGAQIDDLMSLRALYPLSLHGVGLVRACASGAGAIASYVPRWSARYPQRHFERDSLILSLDEGDGCHARNDFMFPPLITT